MVRSLKLKAIKNNFKKGFSIIEVIIGVSLFSVFFTSLIWGVSSLIRLEIKAKERILKIVEKNNEIIEKYYINKN